MSILKTKYTYSVITDREWTDKEGRLHQRYGWVEERWDTEEEAIAAVDKLEDERSVICAWYIENIPDPA